MMIRTIAETAEYLSAFLKIDDLPDGESTPEFRLSILRTMHIPIIKEKLLQLVSNGAVKKRTTAGTSIELSAAPTESTLIEVGEAKAVLEADNPFSKIFEEENELPPFNARPMAVAPHVAKEMHSEINATEFNEPNDQPETVQPATTMPSGLGRKEILSVDWPLITNFTENSLSEALSNVPKWLVPARVARGARGKCSALWNPAIVAACLLDRGYAKHAALNILMRKSFPEWLDQWAEQQGK